MIQSHLPIVRNVFGVLFIFEPEHWEFRKFWVVKKTRSQNRLYLENGYVTASKNGKIIWQFTNNYNFRDLYKNLIWKDISTVKNALFIPLKYYPQISIFFWNHAIKNLLCNLCFLYLIFLFKFFFQLDVPAYREGCVNT